MRLGPKVVFIHCIDCFPVCSSSEVDLTSFMSQSQILTNSNASDIISSLTQSIMSEPGNMKTAAPSITPHLSREDMNANQSL